MSKPILVSCWINGSIIEQYAIYHGITRKQGIINFIEQYFNHNYNTWTYPKTLEGIYKSKFIRDRFLYDYTDNIVVYAQYQ